MHRIYKSAIYCQWIQTESESDFVDHSLCATQSMHFSNAFPIFCDRQSLWGRKRVQEQWSLHTFYTYWRRRDPDDFAKSIQHVCEHFNLDMIIERESSGVLLLNQDNEFVLPLLLAIDGKYWMFVVVSFHCFLLTSYGNFSPTYPDMSFSLSFFLRWLEMIVKGEAAFNQGVNQITLIHTAVYKSCSILLFHHHHPLHFLHLRDQHHPIFTLFFCISTCQISIFHKGKKSSLFWLPTAAQQYSTNGSYWFSI